MKGICVNQEETSGTTSTVTTFETHPQVVARRARELYVALLAQGFTEDQAVDLVGASIIGKET